MSGRSRTKKAAVLLAALALGGLWLWSRAAAIDAEADRLGTIGQGAIRLLGKVKTGLAAGQAGDWQPLSACYAGAASSPEGAPPTPRALPERDGVRVTVWQESPAVPAAGAAITAQLAPLLAPFRSVEKVTVKLDAVEDAGNPQRPIVRSFFWLRGRSAAGGRLETTGHLRLWLEPAGKEWRIARQRFLDARTVEGPATGFTDITDEAGVDFVAHHNPMWSTAEWRPRMFEIVRYAQGGVAVGDYDGDGWEDLFFADGESARLYRNLGDGRFADVTAAAGLPLVTQGSAVALFADLDDDGDQDLFVGYGTQPNRLYRNEGGHFTDVSAAAGVGGFFVTGATAVDYDGDGRLDLYFGRYLDPRKNLPTTLFYTRNGEGNALLHNEGSLVFRDVTAASGTREGGLALGIAWADVDGDGDQDVYVANDFGRNALLENQGDGSFRDVTLAAGAIDYGFGMSASFGDADGDGDLDLYVSNVHSGQRWYGQAVTLKRYLMSSLQQGTLLGDWPLYREIYSQLGADWQHYGDRMVKGNSLLLNDGRGHFTDVAEHVGANPFGWYWGSTFLDYDNDGRLDLYAANGWISGHSTEDL